MECALQRKNKVWIYLSNEDPGISQDKQAKLGIKTHHVSHHNYETENSTCRVLSEKKTRSCNKPNQLSFCHECFSLCSLSLLSRGLQCAATGTAFHLLGGCCSAGVFQKKVLHSRIELPVSTISVYIRHILFLSCSEQVRNKIPKCFLTRQPVRCSSVQLCLFYGSTN